MLIELRDLGFEYAQAGSQKEVLKQINLPIAEQELVALIGPSGSGKSTLLLQFNGLLKPTTGQVLYKGQDIQSKGFDIKGLRRDIGFLFQFPEANLFGQTVYEDIAYGPMNHGYSGEKLTNLVEQAMLRVGLDPEFKCRFPFNLSGGEKRRVALAGVLAMQPKMLILDEPTVGLDPQTRKKFLELVKELNQNGTTILIVSHDLSEISGLAKRVVVLLEGQIVSDGIARRVLTDPTLLEWGLELPEVIELSQKLRLTNKGEQVLTEQEAIEAILERRGIDVV